MDYHGTYGVRSTYGVHVGKLFIERPALQLENLPFALFAGYKELELRMLRGICHPPTTSFLNRCPFVSE